MVLLLATSAVICLCSCDFLRTIAGRPSSGQLEQLRQSERQKMEELSALRTADSLRQAAIDAHDAFVAEGIKIKKASENPNLSGRTFQKGLHLAMGAFSLASNAHKLEAELRSCGYEASLIAYNNGFFLVAAIPSSNYAELREKYLKIRNEKFCPKDAWILECE